MTPYQEYQKYAENQKILPEKAVRWIREHHPKLEKDTQNRKIFVYLAGGRHWEDPETGNKIIPHTVVSRIVGEPVKHCSAGDILRNYQFEFTDFAFSEYSHQKQKCRQILNKGLDQVPTDLFTYQKGEKMFYVNNLKEKTEKSVRIAMKSSKKVSERFTYYYQEQEKIARYLHGRKDDIFLNPLLENFEEAYALALERKDRQTSALLLHNISNQPFPIYWSSQKIGSLCPRLFSDGLPMLPKELRKVLYPKWLDVDIRNCQLAIAGGIFQIEAIQEFLKTGKSIWPELLIHLEIPEEHWPEAKKFLKEGVYSIIYGMPARNVEANITKGLANLGIEKKKKFLAYPLLQALLRGVTQTKEKIKENGGMQGAYGFMPYKKSMDIDSFLSFVVQTYELALIGACFDVAIKEEISRNREFIITLLQHDGFSLQILPGKSKESILQRLQKAVATKGNEFNIIASISE